MSFEGRYQLLCEDGHYLETDVHSYDNPKEECKCSICGKKIVWINVIDDTNYEEYGKVSLVEKTQTEWCTCPDCGVKHIRAYPTYGIPKADEVPPPAGKNSDMTCLSNLIAKDYYLEIQGLKGPKEQQ